MSRLPARKRRRISPTERLVEAESSSEEEAQPLTEADLFRQTSQWNLEQDYEARPRKRSEVKESTRLPIKTSDGQVHAVVPLQEQDASEISDRSSEGEEIVPEAKDLNGLDNKTWGSAREQIIQAKEELAKIAGLLNENPEEHVGSLKTLANITSSKNYLVTKLGLVTQLAVYKDIIPGYRIRLLDEENTGEKLSKEVRKLRNFEQAIVSGYQRYIQELRRISALETHDSSENSATLATVAVSCACNLLEAVPHFNYRTEILQILVSKLGGKTNQNFALCRHAVEHLFSTDDDGNASLEAATMLSKMMKTKNYQIEEDVLNTFLHLRLLSEFSKKGSSTSIDQKVEDDVSAGGRKSKKDRVFWTKKQRKIAKERKVIAKQMKEADAVVSYEDRDQNQAETLKVVFSVYFRILKAGNPKLTSAVLEGLAKYAHLINQEFFGDILEALKEMILISKATEESDGIGETDSDGDFTDYDDSWNSARESLLSINTAFALLQCQDGATAATTLHLDLNFFVDHLYRILYPSALDSAIEDRPVKATISTTIHPATGAAPKSTARLLTTALQSALIPPKNPHSTPPVRLAAFTRAVLTSLLHVPEKSSISLVSLLGDVAKLHKRKIGGLWNTEERKGDGVYDGAADNLERSNPFAGTVWEGELLRLHFCPTVRDGYITGVEGIIGAVGD